MTLTLSATLGDAAASKLSVERLADVDDRRPCGRYGAKPASSSVQVVAADRAARSGGRRLRRREIASRVKPVGLALGGDRHAGDGRAFWCVEHAADWMVPVVCCAAAGEPASAIAQTAITAAMILFITICLPIELTMARRPNGTARDE